MKATIIILVALFCVSCTGTSENEKRTEEWVSKAEKPVVCKKYGENGWGNTIYTLIDAGGNVFNTGCTNLQLPDTLHVTNKKEEQK